MTAMFKSIIYGHQKVNNMTILQVKPLGIMKASFGCRSKKFRLTMTDLSGDSIRRTVQQLYSLEASSNFIFKASRFSDNEDNCPGMASEQSDSDEEEGPIEYTTDAIADYMKRKAAGGTQVADKDLDARWKPDGVLSLYVEGTNLEASAQVMAAPPM